MSIPWIFTGPIRSGKTTCLANWAAQTSGVAGILCPDRGARRWMQDLATGEEWPLEASASSEGELINVGRFWFFQEAFERANSLLINSIHHNPSWIVVDEVGKLELKNEGLYHAVIALLENQRQGIFPGELIFVVRDSLLEEALSYFGINTWKFWPEG